MKNEVNAFYGYNNTVPALISKMCIEAFDRYEAEIDVVPQRTAIARAIGDTIRENIEIMNCEYFMDRNAINHQMNEKTDYLKHMEKATFMKFAEALYNSGNYRVERFNNYHETSFKCQLAVFKIGELK